MTILARLNEMASTSSTSAKTYRERFSQMITRKKTSRVVPADLVTSTPCPAEIQELKTCRTIGRFADHYRLGKEVQPSGHRHMAVHFAIRKSDAVEVVVKLRFKPHAFDNKAQELQWKENMELLMNMPYCENIAAIHEVLEDDKAFYIVMEKVKGLDLFEVLRKQRRPVTVETAQIILEQVLNGLTHLHSRGILHKDLKMENIIYDERTEVAKIIDFDTVELCREPGSTGPWPALPRGASIMGTNQYIAPETYLGYHSPSSEIFAVGVIMYKILSGRFPYDRAIFENCAGKNYVGSSKMSSIRSRMLATDIHWGYSAFKENPLLVDLLQSMMSADASRRPSAAEILSHACFQQNEVALYCAEGSNTCCGEAKMSMTNCSDSDEETDLPGSSVGSESSSGLSDM